MLPALYAVIARSHDCPVHEELLPASERVSRGGDCGRVEREVLPRRGYGFHFSVGYRVGNYALCIFCPKVQQYALTNLIEVGSFVFEPARLAKMAGEA